MYGPKAADGVAIFYQNGTYKQDPLIIKNTVSDVHKNPAKETEFIVNRKKVTNSEFNALKVEDIRAIDWQKGSAPDRLFDIVTIYTRL